MNDFALLIHRAKFRAALRASSHGVPYVSYVRHLEVWRIRIDKVKVEMYARRFHIACMIARRLHSL